jgi:hypothetical protein
MITRFYLGTTADGPSFGGRKKIFSSLKHFFRGFGSVGRKSFNFDLDRSAIFFCSLLVLQCVKTRMISVLAKSVKQSRTAFFCFQIVLLIGPKSGVSGFSQL